MSVPETDLELPPEPSSTRLVATLTVAGLLSGIVLAATYEATLPAIERHRAAALRAAVFEVVPGSAAMQKLVPRDDGFVLATDDDDRSDGVYAAYSEGGQFLGFAIPGAGPGFQDTIALLYGYDPVRRRVVGMRVLDSRETPGLGDKIYKDAAFVGEFDDLALEPPVTVVPRGTAGAPHEVDGISGATISSKAVVRIINERHAALVGALPAPEAVPPAPTDAGAAAQEGRR